MTSNVIDRPVDGSKDRPDRLDMAAYAEALTKFIKDAQTPLTIALQGEWGSGKTSLMNALKKALVDDDGAPYLGVWVNTWQFALMSNPEEAIIKILLGINEQISQNARITTEERSRFLKKVFSFAGSTASQFVAKQIGVDFEKNIKEWRGEGETSARSGVEKLKDEIGACIEKALKNTPDKTGYLFFIDDLDRIDPPVAVQILELLKNIFDLEKCVFVLAIDYGVVVKGLKPKFGEMTTENEREFRSFFDKIIQLPFAMPVGRYKIDNFLTESLVNIGYLTDDESKNEDLKKTLTSYAIESVGTNPRSLKRLINYLSLIRLLIEKTETREDDDDFKEWKDVLFALVCLQIQYPKVYDALIDEPDFQSWGEAFEQKMRLPKLDSDETAKLDMMEEFDEPWEKMLFRFCRRDAFLEARAINISRTLNRIKGRVLDDKRPETGGVRLGEIVQWLTRLSAVTNIKNAPDNSQEAVNFSKSDYLKDLRWHTLGMRGVTVKGNHVWDAGLPENCCIYSWQKRVQSNLECSLWAGRKSYAVECGDYITSPVFHIYHDGKSFQLKIWGEFWGNWPNEKYLGIDFSADDIKSDLAKTLDGVCNAWSAFDVKGNCGCHPGDHVGDGDIWWNVTIPFQFQEQLVDNGFSEKLRGSLAKLAEAFSALLGYRVKANNK